jgi:malonyl-CoA O-methyltransferase
MTKYPQFLDRAAVRRGFNRAARSYDKHAELQRVVADRLLERLDFVDLSPGWITDLGAGTGYCTQALRDRYPNTQIFLCDVATEMLTVARAKPPRWRSRRHYVCADARALPIANGSQDMVFSNLALQWCEEIDLVFTESRRALRACGLLMFSTFGPDTLQELRRAWSLADASIHVNPFMDMHDIGDALIAAGFSGPVMERDELIINYADLFALLRDLKGIGATNHMVARSGGLTTRSVLGTVAENYEAYRRDGVLPATFEVIYGHAWRPAHDTRPQDGSTVTIPIDSVTRRG